MKKYKNMIIAVALVLLSGIGFLGCGLLLPVGSEACIVSIHRGDDASQVEKMVKAHCGMPGRMAYTLLAAATGYAHHIHPGRYDIGSGMPFIKAFNHLRSGNETPLRLTVPLVRTVEDMADFLGKHLEMPADSFYVGLTDSTLLAKYELTPETALCIFLPNTYELYWTITPSRLMERMERESKAFWTEDRQARLGRVMPGFTPAQAITLASIVEQETQANSERADVAGMYINRLRMGMPLQADPTVKFALGDFSIRRIRHEHLKVDSPYNTYKNPGLPPGPICIPSMASLQAVIDFREHNYIYMCAKEDFSGTHNFAADYATHLQNARKYAEALDRRGVK